MAINVSALAPGIDYAVLFQTCIVRSARYMLTRIRLAGAVLSLRDQDQTLHTLDYALSLAGAWPLARDLLIIMAPKMEQAGYCHEWTPYLERGIRQSQAIGDQEAEAELRLQLGILQRRRGELDVARRQLTASAAHFQALGAPRRRARALIHLADVARRQHHFEEAAQLADSALPWLQDDQADRAYAYTVLGGIAFSRQAWPEAADWFERALDLWRKAGDRRMMAWNYTNLGATLWHLGEYRQALVWHDRALALFKELHDPIHEAVARMNLGNAYKSLDQPQEALACYRVAERIFHKVPDKRRLAILHNNIGVAHRQLQQWSEAEQAYRLSIRALRQIGDVHLLANALDGLGLAHVALDRPAEAIATFREALELLERAEDKDGYRELTETIRRRLQEAAEQEAVAR